MIMILHGLIVCGMVRVVHKHRTAHGKLTLFVRVVDIACARRLAAEPAVTHVGGDILLRLAVARVNLCVCMCACVRVFF